MPAKLDRCVGYLKKSGKSESSAYAICSASTGIKKKKGGGWTKGKKATSESFVELFNDVNRELLGENIENNKLDKEGAMIKKQIVSMRKSLDDLEKSITSDDMQVEAWIQNYIGLAEDYLNTVSRHLSGQMSEDEAEEQNDMFYRNLKARLNS